MNNTLASTFNRYKYHNSSIDMHRRTRFNPLQYHYTRTNEDAPLRYTEETELASDLLGASEKENRDTLKNATKPLLPEREHKSGHLIDSTMGHSAMYNIGNYHGDSSGALHRESTDHDNSYNSHKDCDRPVISGKMAEGRRQEDFLDRFIQRESNRLAYYKNPAKLEEVRCEKHPQFIKKSEFLPPIEEDRGLGASDQYGHMKRSRLLPNSIVVDVDPGEREMSKQWAKNYTVLLNRQKGLKTSNSQASRLYHRTHQIAGDKHTSGSKFDLDSDFKLKNTILSMYNR